MHCSKIKKAQTFDLRNPNAIGDSFYDKTYGRDFLCPFSFSLSFSIFSCSRIMYFLLPTCDQRANSSNQALTQAVCINHPSNPSIPSTPEPDSDTASRQTARPLTDDCVQDILRNIEEHWGSPPILTPDTLAYIFAGQLPPKQAPPSLSLRRRQQASVADDDNVRKDIDPLFVSPLIHLTKSSE